MKPSTITALALACIPNLAAARCFGGSNQRPFHALEVMSFFYEAGCELQQNPVVPFPDGQFEKRGKASDGKCLNVLVKNHTPDAQIITSDRAVDAWAREWVGCEHGGEFRYEDGIEYM